jgi:hypothetical protein
MIGRFAAARELSVELAYFLCGIDFFYRKESVEGAFEIRERAAIFAHAASNARLGRRLRTSRSFWISVNSFAT